MHIQLGKPAVNMNHSLYVGNFDTAIQITKMANMCIHVCLYIKTEGLSNPNPGCIHAYLKVLGLRKDWTC